MDLLREEKHTPRKQDYRSIPQSHFWLNTQHDGEQGLSPWSWQPKRGNKPGVHGQPAHKQSVVRPHDGILLRLQKEGNSDTGTARRNPEGVMLSELSQSQKRPILYDSTHGGVPRAIKGIEMESRMAGAGVRGWGLSAE